MSFEFVDANGTRWMVLPGLPATHPEADGLFGLDRHGRDGGHSEVVS